MGEGGVEDKGERACVSSVSFRSAWRAQRAQRTSIPATASRMTKSAKSKMLTPSSSARNAGPGLCAPARSAPFGGPSAVAYSSKHTTSRHPTYQKVASDLKTRSSRDVVNGTASTVAQSQPLGSAFTQRARVLSLSSLLLWSASSST